MKIGIFSDLHGSVEAAELVKKNILPKVDELWFIGDVYYDYKDNEQTVVNRKLVYKAIKEMSEGKLKTIIKGNCDFKEKTDNEFFEKEASVKKDLLGRKAVLIHGHTIKQEEREFFLIENDATILITGHTHIASIETENDYIYINPGSVSYPRDVKNIPTYIVINEETKSITVYAIDNDELIEELVIY